MASSASPPTLVGVIECKVMDDKPKSNSLAAWCSVKWRAILAELLATTLLVLFGCMSCIPIAGLSEQSPLYAPLGFGMAVMFNIQIFGHISGAHMNPAVTVAAVITGNTSIILGLMYIIVQTVGATIGYGILMGLAPVDVTVDGVCVSLPHLGAANTFQIMGIELVMTAILCFVCCSVWDPVNQHNHDSVPIKFGLTITGLALAGGPLTGAGVNPARSFGPAYWTGMWDIHWVYWVGPVIGAAVSASMYRLIFLKKEHYN